MHKYIMVNEVCEKCGSRYVLFIKTMDEKLVSVICMTCAYEKIIDKELRERHCSKDPEKGITCDDLIKQEIQEDQGKIEVYI
jgi:hypothetical protein